MNTAQEASSGPGETPGVRLCGVGEVVQFVDPVGHGRPALVTAVWGPTCVNVVMVATDAAHTDGYGRQIVRSTSVSHQSVTPAHGNYWRHLDETAKPTEH